MRTWLFFLTQNCSHLKFFHNPSFCNIDTTAIQQSEDSNIFTVDQQYNQYTATTKEKIEMKLCLYNTSAIAFEALSQNYSPSHLLACLWGAALSKLCHANVIIFTIPKLSDLKPFFSLHWWILYHADFIISSLSFFLNILQNTKWMDPFYCLININWNFAQIIVWANYVMRFVPFRNLPRISKLTFE